MDIPDAISLIKLKATPSVMRALLTTRTTKVFLVEDFWIAIEGRASGNFRIQFKKRSEQVQFFILNMGHFESHPLKINQWR